MAPIHAAACDANVGALRRILASGVSPDGLDGPERCSPLHHVCRRYDDHYHDNGSADGRVACFELLRDAGANLEARTAGHPEGHTVLHYAARGSPRILSLLLEAGVNVNVENHGGYTPLHWAAIGGLRRTECVELLLKAGAAVNVRTEGGYTPFDIALTKGHRRAYPLFLRAGAEFRNAYHKPYLSRVQGAGGFKKYAQNHLARMTKLFVANGRRLPPEVVRQIMKFWLHLGYY